MPKYKTQILNIKSSLKDYLLSFHVYVHWLRWRQGYGVFSPCTYADSGLPLVFMFVWQAPFYDKPSCRPKNTFKMSVTITYIEYYIDWVNLLNITPVLLVVSAEATSLSAENTFFFLTKDVFSYAREKNLSGQESNKLPIRVWKCTHLCIFPTL